MYDRLFQFFENNYNNLTFFTFEKDGHDRQYKIEEVDLNAIKKEIKDFYIGGDIIKSNMMNSIAKRAGTRQGFPSTPRKTYICNFERAFFNDKYNISDVKKYIENNNFYNIEHMGKFTYYKNWKIYVNDAILEIEGKIPEENLEKSRKENIFAKFFNKKKTS